MKTAVIVGFALGRHVIHCISGRSAGFGGTSTPSSRNLLEASRMISDCSRTAASRSRGLLLFQYPHLFVRGGSLLYDDVVQLRVLPRKILYASRSWPRAVVRRATLSALRRALAISASSDRRKSSMASVMEMLHSWKCTM